MASIDRGEVASDAEIKSCFCKIPAGMKLVY
jgi:hypothetical protein